MKIQLSLVMIIITLCVNAQTDTLYFDEGTAVAKESATTYNVLTRNSDNSFSYRLYKSKTDKIRAAGTYSDTATGKMSGPAVMYFDNGNVEDSAIYDALGTRMEVYHYYANKVLAYHYLAAVDGNKAAEEGYDESGKKVKNYIYEKEAQYKGGEKAWIAFLTKNATTEFTNPKGKEDLTVTVRVQFVVDKVGNVTKPKVVQSSGITAVDRDAVRIIMSSPQWNNSVQYNKPVIAYRVQPITYMLEGKK